MTHEAALTLKKGDYVMHRSGMPSLRPMRVTQVEPSLSGRFVMIRIASLGNCWVTATEYARPRVGWKGDMRGAAWYIPMRGEDGEMTRSYVPDEDIRARWDEETTVAAREGD
jgi:hypothetical protein